MSETSCPVETKPFYVSKRFWSGVATLISGGATICMFVGGASVPVKVVGIALTAVAGALNQWLGYTSPGTVTLTNHNSK